MSDIHAFRLQESGGALPGVPVHPVMRVTFHRSSNGIPLVRTGTAFLISEWDRVLITCGHVVELRGGEVPIRLTLHARCDDGTPLVAHAVSAAYPRNYGGRDMGIIRAGGPFTCPTSFPPGEVASDGGVTIQGYRGAALHEVASNHSHTPPWLQYPEALTSRGMSGGPVLDANGRAIGIHCGEVSIDGNLCNAAIQVDPLLLTRCMEASFAILSGE